MLTKIYKLIFDISICYTIGAFLLEYIGGRSIPIEGFLILLFTAPLAVIFRHKRWRTPIVLLLPIGSLIFLKPSFPELILFLLIWMYFAFVVITERFVISRGEFLDMIRRFAYISILPAVFMFLDLRNLGLHLQTISPYLTTSLISAVFLLRHLRATDQMEHLKLYLKQQIMELITFLTICLLLTLARAPQNLVESFQLMYQYLLRPILTFIAEVGGLLVLGLINLIAAFIGLFTKKRDLQNLDFKSEGETGQGFSLNIATTKVDLEWIRPFLISIGIIVGLVALFYFFRWLMGEKMKQKLPEGILETREAIEDMKDKGSSFRKRRPKDSRAAVRFYYGKHLRWLLHKKVQLRLQDTTEEISDKYHGALMEDDRAKVEASLQLRRLYRKSRYRMIEEITTEEAEQARQLYQTIKATKISE